MNWQFIVRVILKAAILFILLNFLYLAFNPLPAISRISVYNTLLPGRVRLPYSENPPESYNVTLLQLDSMFAAHELSGTEKEVNEYRVLLLGDSAAWGWLLEPDQTLSACINHQNLQTADGRTIRVYNLGYPILDATKDLLILDHALDYEPDLVLWMMTLVSLFPDDQLYHEIVRAHPDRIRELNEEYLLGLNIEELPVEPGWQARTIIGQRRELADWLRHQIYSVAWTVTDIDHRNPKFFTPVQENLYGGTVLFNGKAETIYAEPTELSRRDLALPVLQAGMDMTTQAGAEMVIINEPIFRSSGGESDLRYNFYYPRWAYDSYRERMLEVAQESEWNYVDLWDVAPSDQFTDSSLHLTPSATCDLAVHLGEIIQTYAQ